MPLPALVEVAPFSAEQLEAFRTTKAEIVIPGSKSITNRAIVLAALGDGEVTLRGALWSEDTEAMTDCMRRLGIDISVAADPDVDANRTITVRGCGGKLPNGGTEAEPLELFVQNAGTAARFLTAMVCLGDGVYRLSGVPRMHERPQKDLILSLRALGYRVDTPNDKLPAVVHGGGPKAGPVTVSVEDSSQVYSVVAVYYCVFLPARICFTCSRILPLTPSRTTCLLVAVRQCAAALQPRGRLGRLNARGCQLRRALTQTQAPTQTQTLTQTLTLTLTLTLGVSREGGR